MSEVKVLHEWTDCGCKWSVRDDDSPFSGDPVICRDDKEIESGVLARELARLAARARELEAAVRWRFDDLFGEAGNFQMPHELRATLGELLDAWIAAHPIVRSVIEKGGE